MSVAKGLAKAKAALKEHGLLLLSDSALPSLVSVLTGDKLKGSWWSHPQGNLVFNVGSALEDEPDVLMMKLVSGKVTFVARELWADVLAAVVPPEPWQTAKLSAAEKALLRRVEKEGRTQKPGPCAKALEKRLLAWSSQIHTETGAHALVLTSWRRLAKERKLKLPRAGGGAAARRRLDLRLDALNEAFGAKAKWPWPRG